MATNTPNPSSPPTARSTRKNWIVLAVALAQAFSGAAGEAQLVLLRRDGTPSAVLTLLSRQP